MDMIVGLEIRKLSQLMRRYVASLPVIKEHDSVTGIQGWVVGYIFHHQEQDIYQRDIEEAFSMKRSTATVVLQKMEKNGLIERCPVAHDARLKKIILTDYALAIQNQIDKEIIALEERLTKGMTEEEIQGFHNFSKKLEINLSQL